MYKIRKLKLYHLYTIQNERLLFLYANTFFSINASIKNERHMSKEIFPLAYTSLSINELFLPHYYAHLVLSIWFMTSLFLLSFSYFFPFVHIRYNALAVCLLPITADDRSKELSLSSPAYNRDRAIKCLKRAGIDDYKVSQISSFFSSSSVLFESKKERKN